MERGKCIGETDALTDAVQMLSTILDIEEEVKLLHGIRVGVVCGWIAQALQCPQPRLVYYAGLLHDVGAVGLPEHISHYAVNPPEHLRKKIEAHASIGSRLITNIPFLEDAAAWILYHHERYDGQGYPLGLKGYDIPLEAQIIRAADSLDVWLRRGIATKSISMDYLRKSMRERKEQEYSSLISDVLFDEVLNKERFHILVDEEELNVENKRIPSSLGFEQERVYTEEELLYKAYEAAALIIDTKDRYTFGHSRRVALYSLAIAAQLSITDERLLSDLVKSAFLHDAGKVGTPGRILVKNGPLTPIEWETMKKHVVMTERILMNSQFMARLAGTASAHHERYDGSGYCRGLKDEDIPYLSRIISVADVFDALTSDRPYRPSLSIDEALWYLERRAGTHFDPVIARAGVKILGTAKNWALHDMANVKENLFPFYFYKTVNSWRDVSSC